MVLKVRIRTWHWMFFRNSHLTCRKIGVAFSARKLRSSALLCRDYCSPQAWTHYFCYIGVKGITADFDRKPTWSFFVCFRQGLDIKMLFYLETFCFSLGMNLSLSTQWCTASKDKIILSFICFCCFRCLFVNRILYNLS